MNKSNFILPLATVLALSSTLAVADLRTDFDEGAPKDRFTFSNTSKCIIENAKVTLDLSGSKSGLIFDVTNKGAGVEVFQPLQIVSGATALASVPKVKDGDNRIVFDVKQLKPSESFAFTIDVDDTTSARKITVNGSEISGASVRLVSNGQNGASKFNQNAQAVVKIRSC